MQRSTQLKRTASLRRQVPVRRRNAKRLKRLRALQFGPQADLCRISHCALCDAPPPSDPHHVKARGFGGVKSDDSQCVPLCRPCHDDVHRLGLHAWTRRGRDPDKARAKMRAFVKGGWADSPVSPLLGNVAWR